MAGVCVSGVVWAIFQNNAGGAWDNAKKSFEAGVEINGEKFYKGSEPHKAAVIGDTVGDPFKDTSGPSMNILIKLTCLVGLAIAPILGEMYGHSHGGAMNQNPQGVEGQEILIKRLNQPTPQQVAPQQVAPPQGTLQSEGIQQKEDGHNHDGHNHDGHNH
jgi:K(+)-stimulated pyrophosphate-energized sodium pump